LTALQTAVDPHSPTFVAAADGGIGQQVQVGATLAQVETHDTQTDGPQTDDTQTDDTQTDDTAGDQP